LGLYRMMKEEFGVKKYIGSSQGQEAIRCQFWMSTGGPFADERHADFVRWTINVYW